MKLLKRTLSIIVMMTFMVTTYGTYFDTGSVYAATPEKKEKFIVKHQDNERLKAKFFPDEVVVEEAQLEEPEVTTDSAVEVVIEEVVDPLTYEVVSNDITAVEGTLTEIQDLIDDPDIIAVEYDSAVTINADVMPQSLVAIGEDQINDPNFNGAGVKVAIIDTGIDTQNTDLNVVGGVSFIEGTTYDDDNGHGTALAGIIGAKENGEGLVGIAPEAELYAVKALDSTGTGYYSDVIKALEWCTENRMDIVVMSFGADEYSGILHEAVQTFYLQDGLMIAAAGNADSTVQYPAAYQEVMAVGAVNYSNEKLYTYSDEEKVDIYTIGTGVETYGANSELLSYQGSSVSAAHVAGVASELWSVDMTKTNNMIREQLIVSSSKNNLVDYPILDAYQVYIDEVGDIDVDVDPNDNLGDVDDTDETNALVTIQALPYITDDKIYFDDESFTINIAFSDPHEYIEYYLVNSEGNRRTVTKRVDDVANDYDEETGQYPENGENTTPFLFDFIPAPGEYYIKIISPDNNPGGVDSSEYTFFDDPITILGRPKIEFVSFEANNLTPTIGEDFAETVELTVSFINTGNAVMIGDGDLIIYILDENGNVDKLIDEDKHIIETYKPGVFTFDWTPKGTGDFDFSGSFLNIEDEVKEEDNYFLLSDYVDVSWSLNDPSKDVDVPNGDPIDTSSGNYTVEVKDIEISGKSPIEFIRSYNGLDYVTSSLGKHWRTNCDIYSVDQPEYTKVYFADGHTEFFNLNASDEYVFDESKYNNVYKDSNNQLILEFKGDITYTFVNNRISKIVDSTNETTFVYVDDKLSKVVSNSGSFEITYDNALIDYITDSSNRVVDYNYTNGLLTDITNVDGHTWHYEYNDVGLIEKTINPDMSVELINDYDDESRVYHQINEDGTSISFEYTDDTTIFTDRDGSISTYHKDEKGRLDHRIYPDGEEKYVFDDNDNIIEFVDKNGNTTNYYYNDNGDMTSETNALGEVTSYTYTPSGKRSSKTNPDGTTTLVSYNASNLVENITDELGRMTSFVYDEYANIISVIQPDLSEVHMTYDASGNMISSTDADGNQSAYTYDGLNRVKTVTDSNGNTTTKEYLPSGRVESISYANGSVESKTYNNKGELVSETDKLGRTTSYTYTVMGDVETITQVDGTTMTYEYDTMQRVIAVTNPDGSVTSFGYDQAGRRTSMTDADGFTSSYSYDNNGNILSEVDPRGNQVTYEYDQLNRLISSTNALNNKSTLTYRYDNQVLVSTDALGNQYKNMYDDAGQLVKEILPTGAETEYAYDLLGRVSSMTDALGQVTSYEYNALNQVTKVVRPDSSVETMTYDGVGNLLTATNAIGQVTTYAYDEMNQLESVTDARGFQTFMTYTLDGQVSSITDADGYVSTYEYDVMNRLLSEIDPRGNEVRYTYDLLGNLEEIHQYNGTFDNHVIADELITYLDYNHKGQVTKEVNPLGQVTLFSYDGNGNLISQTDALSQMTTFTYDVLNNLTKVTKADQTNTTFEYDALNRMVNTIDHEGYESLMTYDVLGNIQTVIDANANETKYTYDPLQRIKTVTDALNQTTSFEYRYDGLVLSSTDPMGNVYRNNYDTIGQLITSVLPTGDTTTYAYDASGYVESMTDAIGYQTGYTYDGRGNVISELQPDLDGTLLTKSFSYDENSNMIQSIDPLGNESMFTYDYLNRLVSARDAMGNISSTQLDAMGNVISSSDALGRVTSYNYDELNQLISEIDPAGNTVAYTYDHVGNLSSITELKGVTQETIDRMTDATGYDTATEAVVTSYIYDSKGQLLEEITALGKKAINTFDGVGNLVKHTDEGGYQTSYEYDAVNQLKSVTYDDGKTVTYTYNANKQQTSMTDWLGTNTYDLDVIGRILTATDFEGKTTAYTYNSRNQKQSMVYPDESEVLYHYDIKGRLESVIDGNSGITTYTYDALDRVVEEVVPNGNRTSYSYDSLSRVNTLKTINKDGVVILDITSTFDGNGNKLTELETALQNVEVTSNTVYTYDTMNQLITSTEEGIATNYFYDTVGNRIRKEIHNPSDSKEPLKVTNYTYDKGNKINWMQGPDEEVGGHITSDAVIYTYDSRGNMTKIQSNDGVIGQYYYDATNKMTYSINKMGVGSQYTYDGEGRRVKQAIEASNINVSETSKLHDQELIETLLGDDNLIVLKTKAEINYVIDVTSPYNNVLMTFGDHTLTQRYTYGLDLISIDTWHETEEAWEDVEQRNFEESLYYVQDTMGSTRALVRDDGKLGAYYSYDAFGTPQEKNHVKDQGIRSNIYHYAGYVYDYATSLYFVNARYYIPEVGRFAEKDIYRGDGLNRYVYVRSNPLKFVDPSGYMKSEGADFIKTFDNPDDWITDQDKILQMFGLLDNVGEGIDFWSLDDDDKRLLSQLLTGASDYMNIPIESIYNRMDFYDVNGNSQGKVKPNMIQQLIKEELVKQAMGAWKDNIGLLLDSIEDKITNSSSNTVNYSDLSSYEMMAVQYSLGLYATGEFNGVDFDALQAIYSKNDISLYSNKINTNALTVIRQSYSNQLDSKSDNESLNKLSEFLYDIHAAEIFYSLAVGWAYGNQIKLGKTVTPSFMNGTEGEQYLFKMLGGETQKYINTPYGKRFIDVFSNGVAHESKVGYASLSKFIKKQIIKDVYARDVLNSVDDVVWHFFKSGVTGKQGPSKPLMDFLNKNGIEVIIH